MNRRLYLIGILFASTLFAGTGLRVEVDYSPYAGGNTAEAWFIYLITRSNYIGENRRAYPEVEGVVMPRYEEETVAREMLADYWMLLREEHGKPPNRYLDDLVKVYVAGFIREYVWHFLRREEWGDDPPSGLRLDAFSAWATNNIPDHRVITHGRVRLARPRDAGSE